MWPTIKKYGKYIVILGIGVLVVVAWVTVKQWLKKKQKDDAGLTEGTEKLKDVIVEIKDQMTEANQQAAIEIAAGRSEETETKAKLSEVTKIKNKTERRQKLADLYKEVTG